MKFPIGPLLCFLVLSGAPAWAREAKPPAGKAFMEVYSNMYLVPVENDFVGYQVAILHAIHDTGEELKILWQEGEGGLSDPELLTPEKRGDALVIHVPNDGDWTLRISKGRIDAVSPRGQHETLRRIRTLN
jgi:hypothetical protein